MTRANVDMHEQQTREAVARMASLLSPTAFASHAPETFAAWARAILGDADACIRQLRALADLREIDGDAARPRPLTDHDHALLARTSSREAISDADEATLTTIFRDARLLCAVAVALHPDAASTLTQAAALPSRSSTGAPPTGRAAHAGAEAAPPARMHVVPAVAEHAPNGRNRFSIGTLLVGAAAGFLIALVLLPLMLGGSGRQIDRDAWSLDPDVAARLQQPEGQALLARLRDGLGSGDIGVRTMAAFHLARLRRSLAECVPVLVDALDRPEIQPVAQRGLLAFGPSAVPVMLSTVAAPAYAQRPAVRDNVVLVLETMGSPAVAAVEATAAEPGRDAETRGFARHVLRSIRREVVAEASGAGYTLRIEEMEELIVDIDTNGVRFRRVFSATASAIGENASANIAINGENFSVRANATASNGTATSTVTTSNNGRSVRVEQHSNSESNSASNTGNND